MSERLSERLQVARRAYDRVRGHLPLLRYWLEALERRAERGG